MSVASELHTSLRSMGFVQLLLALVFLAGYAVACSPLFDARGRWRAGGIALLSAVAFITITDPWVHGVLMIAGVVAGLGLFSAMGWALSTVLKLPTPDALAEPLAASTEVAVEALVPVAPQRAPSVTRIPAA